MADRVKVHIIGEQTGFRAIFARLAFNAGYHAEIYSNLEELIKHAPKDGFVFAHDDGDRMDVATVIEAMTKAGQWLPVIAVSEAPSTESVVRAIKAGALDYLQLPSDVSPLTQSIAQVEREAHEQRAQRSRVAEARQRIARLSLREREVLDRLADGYSNKAIARDLEISPRTVEIHRMKMMGKLGVRHAAEAVRLKVEASRFDAAA